jgi:hypothetical protein
LKVRNRFSRIILIAASGLFLTAGTALARSSHSKTAQITVLYTSKIGNGPELKPGNYKVEVAANAKPIEVTFYQNGRLVAQAPAKLVNEGKKADDTQIYYNNAGNEHVITRLDMQGWNEQVMFPASGHNAAGS